ncbi:tape measure protein [Enterococcus sp. AZ103]|uniref:tape measure protein n=1 Tax=Enterococcus sp. AZ103 TaxID=2774628 RepID=UPI003F26469B
MADGRISIQIDADGRPIRSLNTDLDKLEGKSGKASGGIKDIVTGLGLVKIASAAFNVLAQSVGDATARFDTMQKYPKVMSALGFSADDSKKSVNKLADGIDGLPTRLDSVVSTAQRMTSVTGNMNKSTDATIALNNAMLASGASTDDASRGMEQYIQMLSTGKVDMQSWRTLQETMPIGLQKTAEAMGFVGETAQSDLYSALKKGTITFKDFQNQLIELGTGTGELAKLAKINSEGIGTSFENLKSAVVKGLANVMKAMDDATKALTGKTIAQNLDSTKVIINKAFESITGAIGKVTPYLESFGKVIKSVFGLLEPYTPAITGFVEAITAMLIIRSVSKAFLASEAAIRVYLVGVKAVQVASTLYTLAINAQARAELAKNLVERAGTTITALSLAAITAKNVAMGILTGTTSLATVATSAFGAAIKAALGPIGWVTAAIGLLVAGGVALYKQLSAESDEYKQLKKEQEGVISSSEKLSETTETNIQNRKSEIESIESSKKSYQDLIVELDALSAKQGKTTAEKNNLKKIVDELNNSVKGLNISYDAQNDTLSQTPAKITEQVNAFKELGKAQEAQKQMNTIIEERNSIEAKLMEINALRKEWNETVGSSPAEAKKAAEAVEELDSKEAKLKETQFALQTEFQSTARVHEEAINLASVAVENGVFKQQVSYEALNDTQKEVMDSMRSEYQSLEEKATNAFEQISVSSAISTEEMIANLQKNQETIAAWSENIAALADRGVNQGLLEQLRKMGPEGAAYTAELVNASDEQLQRLNEVYGNGGSTAMSAMSQSLQLGKVGVNDEVAKIIPESQATMGQQIAAADFGSVGKDMTDQMRVAIETNKKQVSDITGSMIDDAATLAKTKAAEQDFKSIGTQIPAGMRDGINEGSKEAEEAAGNMANKLPTVAKDNLAVHSPSRVFHEIGENVTQGLADGIESKKEEPKGKISSLVESLISATNSFTDSMGDIGANAMAGLANGIINNSAQAIQAAQDVASQITQTMQSALDINSPSRVMRDKVGRFIPQGIAVGIDKDAHTIDDSLKKISTNMFRGLTPELALGGNQIGALSRGNSVVNNSTSSSKTYQPVFHINIEKADLSSDKGVENTSRQLAILTERQQRGRLE